ncbi:glycine N-methyltransferase-like [Lytechinus pictus]|uniref:glycine N-methyltransferase-like n=1 Tax=Lytechinus pictus TaxID=7653 RepID=UPI0030B9E1EB
MSQSIKVINSCDDEKVVLRLGVLTERSNGFKQWLLHHLRSRNCSRVLDVACGTGGDSLFLLKHGFQVVSSDSAEAMLRQARHARKSYESEQQHGTWDIEKANWLTLKADLGDYGEFDAVLCMGNSLLCLTDPTPNFGLYRRCLENFKSMLKPGGVLLLDHRNIDVIMDLGDPINKNVYFREDNIKRISSAIVHSHGQADVVNFTFDMLVNSHTSEDVEKITNDLDMSPGNNNEVDIEKVSVPLQAIRAQQLATLLAEVFGENCERALYGDFKSAFTISDTAYFQHVITKKK